MSCMGLRKSLRTRHSAIDSISRNVKCQKSKSSDGEAYDFVADSSAYDLLADDLQA